MYLSDLHVKNFHSDLKGHLAKMKGYYLFAVDSSKANLPNAQKNQKFYGAQVNQFGQRAQIGMPCLYDVLNKMMLAFSVNHRGFSELVEAKRHIEKIPIRLPGDQGEVLATNLTEDEFTWQEIADIYRTRWGIETAYDVLKNSFSARELHWQEANNYRTRHFLCGISLQYYL